MTAAWERVTLGPFTVTAVPAVDGQRLFHGGDTKWRGYRWPISQRVGPITVAALPITGAAVNVPHLQPASPHPAVLTPEQAIMAAHVLH